MKTIKQKKLLSFVICLSILLSLVLPFSQIQTANTVAAKKATLKKKSITVEVGETKKIAIKNKNKKNKYTFSSNRKSVATVSKKGVVTGESAGNAVITVKEKTNSKSRKLGKIKVTVFDDVPDYYNNNQSENNSVSNTGKSYVQKSTSSSSSSANSSSNTSRSEIKTYGLNQPWIVDGQWKFTVTGIENHYRCNHYDDDPGEEVIIISYYYEDLGYVNLGGHLYFGEIGYSSSAQVYDSEKNSTFSYACTHQIDPKSLTIPGAKCSASKAILLPKSGGHEITIYLSKQTNNNNGYQKAYFVIPY